MKSFNVAVIGCGMISGAYLGELCQKGANRYNIINVVGCSDIKPERSKAKAEEFGIRCMTNQEIFDDPTIDIVINLTNHTSHFVVSKQALLAGKHVYSEKMMTITLDEAKELGEIAKSKELLFCCAPDTFLGSAMQTARAYVDSGLIGDVVAGTAVVVRGYHHERYRTDPERRFAFCPGGGIMYDMGCYYLASLINLLGGIKRACGFSQIRGANDRLYANPKNPDYGKVMKIESPNNACGVLEFENGALVSLMTSSEGVNDTNYFTLFGTKGTIRLIDPNCFDGDVFVSTGIGAEARLPVTHTLKLSRGAGVADMCYAIKNNREPRCSFERAIHMLEAGCAIMFSAESGRYHEMETSCTRPAPLAQNIPDYFEMMFDL